MNTIQKVAVGTVAATIIMMTALPVYAESRGQDIRDARKNLIEVRKDFRQDLKEKVASRVGAIKSFFKARMSIISGKITAINNTVLTIKKDGKSYTVLTGEFDKCTTKFRRRFWGNSDLNEYAVGHMVNIFGRWQDEAKTTVEACVIRDISIQKRFGVFVGHVLSLTSGGWVMSTVGEKRANQTVTVVPSTKYVNRKEEPITKSDIKVGDRIRVKGLWDRSANTVTEVTHVKNYSLPPKVTGTVTLTPTATVTAAPTTAATLTPTATVTVTPTATVAPTVTVTPTATPAP